MVMVLMLMHTVAKMIARLQAEHHGSDEVSNNQQIYILLCAVLNYLPFFFLRGVFMCRLLLVASVFCTKMTRHRSYGVP
jgi:hypothetical protein